MLHLAHSCNRMNMFMSASELLGRKQKRLLRMLRMLRVSDFVDPWFQKKKGLLGENLQAKRRKLFSLLLSGKQMYFFDVVDGSEG